MLVGKFDAGVSLKSGYPDNWAYDMTYSPQSPSHSTRIILISALKPFHCDWLPHRGHICVPLYFGSSLNDMALIIHDILSPLSIESMPLADGAFLRVEGNCMKT